MVRVLAARNFPILIKLSLTVTLMSLTAAFSVGEAVAGQRVLYRCEGGARVFAHFLATDRAVLEIGGRIRTVRNTRAASESRYEGNGITFWLKGEDAMLDRPEVHSTTCRVAQ